jgi:hypothetical protein
VVRRFCQLFVTSSYRHTFIYRVIEHTQ